MFSFNIIDIFILNQVLPSIFNKVAHQTWHECFVLIKLDSSNSHRQTSRTVVHTPQYGEAAVCPQLRHFC